MKSFVNELAERLANNASYWDNFLTLQSTGAGTTLPNAFKCDHAQLLEIDVVKLLYCASIFVQTDDDHYKAMAQSIALNSLLSIDQDDIRERCVRILTELGNFPGLTYVEKKYGASGKSLLSMLQRRVSEELNTIAIGSNRLSLTDYQKLVWDTLPNANALAISAPTSAGKSFLVIEHLCRMATLASKFSAVYVAPTRALLAEVLETITTRMKDVKGVRVSSIPSLDAEQNDRQLFVLTQERLQVLLSVSEMNFDLVIIDEVQNLSDGARGMILQETIEQIIQRNSGTRIVMLAPGAEGFPDAATSVGIENLVSAVTTVSPVLQNRILVDKSPRKDELRLRLLSSRGIQPIGVLPTARGFDLPATRLAAVALELGSQGGSLVYATGPSDAEKVALQLSQERDNLADPILEELATFIEQHIHPEYKLASMVRRGVAFHYGKMPNLLREALEVAFKAGLIKFLTCTTTLFQGVNLPARNVFIGTPTRGKGTLLDPALLWNFAGRAGRMRKDIVGNVFLVDYDEWVQKPMGDLVRFKIRPAFKEAITESYDAVIEGLGGNMPKTKPNDDQPAKVRAAVGLLVARAARGDILSFTKRVLPDLSASKVLELNKVAVAAAEKIDLPAALLASNWTIDPFGQKRLYDKIVEKIRQQELKFIIPISPHETDAYQIYTSVFNLIAKSINGYDGNFGSYVSVFALPWMKGVPYPVIVAKSIKKERERVATLKTERARTAPINTSKIIREVFDVIEDVVRFQYVQLGKAYIDILSLALRTEGRGDLVTGIFDFSLSLELGVATASGKAYVELGLSRIAATALDQLYPNTNLTVADARKWLWDIDLEASGLGSVIVSELRRLNLVPPEISEQMTK